MNNLSSQAYKFLTRELNSPITVMFPVFKASALNRIFILNHFNETLYKIQIDGPDFITIITFHKLSILDEILS